MSLLEVLQITIDGYYINMRGCVLFAGRGIFLTAARAKGKFIVEYSGELIAADEGKRREEDVDDSSVFRYYFRHNNNNYWLVG